MWYLFFAVLFLFINYNIFERFFKLFKKNKLNVFLKYFLNVVVFLVGAVLFYLSYFGVFVLYFIFVLFLFDYYINKYFFRKEDINLILLFLVIFLTPFLLSFIPGFRPLVFISLLLLIRTLAVGFFVKNFWKKRYVSLLFRGFLIAFFIYVPFTLFSFFLILALSHAMV